MTRKALTIEEIMAMIEDEDDGIDTVCVVPPDRIDEVTDEEYIDDNEIPINDNVCSSRFYYMYYGHNFCFYLANSFARSSWHV